jgi:hypothetical protein
LPYSKVNRAFYVFIKEGFPAYTGDNFYPDLAYSIVMKYQNSTTNAAAAKSHLLSLPAGERM